jgi:hypothetical protein
MYGDDYDHGFDDGLRIGSMRYAGDVRDRVLRALIARDWAVAIQIYAEVEEICGFDLNYGFDKGALWTAERVGRLPAPVDVIEELFP